MMLMNVMAVDRERRDASDAIPERRRWPRSRAARVRARIAWRARGFPEQKFPIRLIDISQGGARIAIDSPEPPDLPCFWVGLRSLPCEWVKSRVQEVLRQDHSWIYRLLFLEDPCPGLIELAVERRA
jgi:hypothetical protein